MILQLTEDATSIGIRIRDWANQRYLVDWQGLALGILPGEHSCHGSQHCCEQGGSPWFVWGCWPGHRTGVDLMNPPRPDFPAFYIQASDVNAKDNLVIFNLPDRWRKTVPFGRYSGFVRYQPDKIFYDPINSHVNLGVVPTPKDPGCYHTPPQPCGCPMPPPLRPCILAEFDVDYGPRCSQHIIDRIDVELENE